MAEQLSVIERIRQSGNTLGVKTTDIKIELKNLFGREDLQGARELFKAYLDWEWSNASLPHYDAGVLARRNFDGLAQALDSQRGADNFVSPDGSAGTMVLELGSFTYNPDRRLGPISTFVRRAIWPH